MKTPRILLLLALWAVAAQAQLPTKQVLTLDAAKKVAAAAEAEAKKRGATVVIAVVDDGGYLLVLERLDDTQVASVDVGIAKARTAAIFRRPSGVFEDQVKNGRIAALALPGAVALKGGVPIIVDGKVIGAVGVSVVTLRRKMKTSPGPRRIAQRRRLKEVPNESRAQSSLPDTPARGRWCLF